MQTNVENIKHSEQTKNEKRWEHKETCGIFFANALEAV